MAETANDPHAGAWVAENEGHRIRFEPTPRRVRVAFGGEVIADSRRAMILLESGYLPVYYFPQDDVRMERLRPSEHHTHCPFKGEAAYWSVEAGGRVAENAVWSYPEPITEASRMAGYMAFYWNKMDHWYEEDDAVFVHPRDPYKRVDVVGSTRPVRVVLAGETVAESARARFLFETGLPTRYYLPPEDVRMELLEESERRTECPYKGVARYWSARVGGKLFEDIVWCYPEPIPECPLIEGYLCFFNEHVDDILVDGEAVAKVETPWSGGWK